MRLGSSYHLYWCETGLGKWTVKAGGWETTSETFCHCNSFSNSCTLGVKTLPERVGDLTCSEYEIFLVEHHSSGKRKPMFQRFISLKTPQATMAVYSVSFHWVFSSASRGEPCDTSLVPLTDFISQSTTPSSASLAGAWEEKVGCRKGT